MRRIVIGCGTGRCGTKSLNLLFLSQPDVWVCHENADNTGFLTWDCKRHEFDNKMTVLKARYSPSRHYLVGNIGPWWLPCAEWLMEDSGVRVVCMERNEEDTVRSLTRQRFDLFSETPRPGLKLYGDDRNLAYPKFPGDRETAAHAYWRMYHRVAGETAAIYPNGFRVFSIEQLNSESGQVELLKWAGVPDPRPCPVSPGKYFFMRKEWVYKRDISGEPDQIVEKAMEWVGDGRERRCT